MCHYQRNTLVDPVSFNAGPPTTRNQFTLSLRGATLDVSDDPRTKNPMKELKHL